MKAARILLWTMVLIAVLMVQLSVQDEKKDDDKKTPQPTPTPKPTQPPKKDECDEKDKDSKGDCKATPKPTPPPKKDECDEKDKDFKGECKKPKPECCKCPPTPTPKPTPKPAVPCKMVCQDGFVMLKINVPQVKAVGDLADYLDLEAPKAVSAKLSILFKPDFVTSEDTEKPKHFWLHDKGAYCFEVFKEETLKFSSKGNVADGVAISATLNPNKDQVTIEIKDGDQDIRVLLKKGSNGFGALEQVLNMNMPVATSNFALVADLAAHVAGQKEKDMDLSASKVSSQITVTKCQPKIPPTVCPPCNSPKGCDNVKKCQVSLQDTKAPSHNKTIVIKLDAAWRSCFNRTNTRKSEDFLISLLSIRECISKDQSNCPRSVFDFSPLKITGGSPNGIPNKENPTVTAEGKLTVVGTSGNQVYLKIVVTLIKDGLKITCQLNKGDKWQWVPQEKNSVIIFTFKVWGQMAVIMLPKNENKSDIKTIQFEIRDNVKLQTKPGFTSDFIVKTRLNLDFPMKVNGQFIKIVKKEIQQGKATLIDLVFSKYHFTNGILNYGPITGEMTYKQFTPAAAEADTNANAALQAGQSSADEQGDRQAESSACALANWVALV